MSPLGIQARAVEKHFTLGHGHSPKRAVDGVTFEIREGERVGFIGRNGAGKTTLLQMLAGIASPSAGELKVAGRVTAIFTLGLGLREDLTGLQNILVEGELLGHSREDTLALAGEIAAFADLGEFIDRPVRTYSTGMKARLAFSTIVHVEPEILIVDEALSVGDARFSAKASAKMRDLAARGRILIVVSHSMQAIDSMCTRCIWLDEGRVRMDGPSAEVTQAYLDEVHQADDAGVLARLKGELADQSLRPGWAVDALEVRNAEGVAPKTVVTGEPATIFVRVLGAPGVAFTGRLSLTRLDGLRVWESAEEGAQSFNVLPAGACDLRIDLGSLPLNGAIYRAEFEALVQGAAVARRSVLFEVRNPRPHRGGRPVLVYPTQFSVTPVLE